MKAATLRFGLVLAVFAGGCSDGASPEPPRVEVDTPAPPTTLAFGVDPEFIESVLADGVVTFEEFVLTHQHKFRCMAEAGLEGKVALDLTLHYDGPSELSHPSAEHLYAVTRDCERSIWPVHEAYLRDHSYNTPEILEQQRVAVLSCLSREASEVYADMSDDWDLQTITEWLGDVAMAEDYPADSTAATDCLNSLDAPWQTLREAAGLDS